MRAKTVNIKDSMTKIQKVPSPKRNSSHSPPKKTKLKD